MHILHIDLGRELRGGQRQVLLLMRGLREAGHTCELLARPDGPLWQEAAALQFPLTAAGLRATAGRSRLADLVHAQDARAHTLAALASRQVFVVSRRVAFPVQAGVLSRWKYSRARRFLAVSQFVADQLAAAGIPRQKIDVVYDGVPLPGTFAGHGTDAVRDFLIVAPDSSDPGKGRALAQQAAHLAGLPILFSNDLGRDLPRASVFLYLTSSEGLGSAVLLAMALGIPVVASRIGGLPEAIVQESSGLLVENDPPAIARALERLRGDRPFAADLAANARSRFLQTFTASHMVEATLAAYRRALAV